jgi:phospholipid/cholesterol/gamma-HCH transport system permease protein
VLTLHGLGAFALITIGIMTSRFGRAHYVIRPLVHIHLARAGLGLLPMMFFIAVALGLVVIGQTVSLLSQVGAQQLLGTIMATVVVRELGPLLAALLVLSKIGTANVIELGTARAQGEVESLEAMGIDPIHYLVVPRVLGLSLGIFSLTVYLILGAIFSGYLRAFAQDVPIMPGEYFQQLAEALRGLDFVVLALKTLLFGSIIAVVTCYHGLAQPLRLEEVSAATIRAVGQSVILCVVVDALFIILYLSV